MYREIESKYKQDIDDLDTRFRKEKADLDVERSRKLDEIESTSAQKRSKLETDSKSSGFIRRRRVLKKLKIFDAEVNAKKAQVETDYNTKLSSLQDSIDSKKLEITSKVKGQYDAVYRTEHALTSPDASLKEIRVAKSYIIDEIVAIKPGDSIGFSGRTLGELFDIENQLDARASDVAKATRDRIYRESQIDPAAQSLVSSGQAKKYTLGKDRTPFSHETIVQRVRDIGIRDSFETNKITKQISELAKHYNVSEIEMKQVLDKKVREVIESGEFGTRKGIGTLEKCLDGGYIKNQFETGKSSGFIESGTDKGYKRSGAEHRIFGLSLDTPYVDRPVYGMLFPAEDVELKEYIKTGPGSWYGSGSSGADKCVVLFNKDAISDTTSFTIGDSLDYEFDHALAAPISEPKYSGSFRGFAEKYSTLQDLEKADIIDLFNGDSEAYLELQIHGQEAHAMTAENIKEVIFPVTPSQTLQDKLKLHGIPWRVLKKGRYLKWVK